MRFLTCPDQIEIALTNVVGDPMKVRREGLDGRVIVEPMLANWWDFIISAASQEKFFDKLSGIEAIELGLNFRKTIFEAKAANAKVIALDDDVAKRLAGEVMARTYDRNTQHCFYDWVKAVDSISAKDPRAILNQPQADN